MAQERIISVIAVRANQLPLVVSPAEAMPLRTLNVSIPSRARSATVTPEMRLSQSLGEGVIQTPRRLRRMPPFKQAIRAARFLGDNDSIDALRSPGASVIIGADEFVSLGDAACLMWSCNAAM
jgi:hypothetical protein